MPTFRFPSRMAALLLAGLTAAPLLSVAAGEAHAQALSCNTNFFPLYCRGKLNLVLGPGAFIINFTRNPVAAGTTGATLLPGSCAFADRPVSSAEPNILAGFEYLSNGAGGSIIDLTVPAVQQCVADGNCVFELCIQNNGQGTLIAQQAQAGLLFPHFSAPSTLP